MKIARINIYQVLLPFVAEFSHSLKKGDSARNIIVEVIAEGGEITGYGEGAPRTYVTGESQESAVDSISRFVKKNSFPWELDDVDALWRFTEGLIDGSGHYAAICALETALLDLLGKSQGLPAAAYFSQNFYTDIIHYGAAVPLAGKERVSEICRFIKNVLKIRKIKLKLNRNYDGNRRILEAVRQVFGEDYDLKIDVNCDWDLKLAMAHVDLIRQYNIKVVEQPMIPDHPDIAEFSACLDSLGVALMADESACSLKEVKRLHEEGYYNMINVRLSKCGGIRNSLRIIDYLRGKKIPFQIACQLGESGILSAAGRIISLLCRDAVYYDGSYDQFLLKENATTENVSFGSGGKAGPLEGHGLGVAVSRKNLERLSVNTSPLSLSRP